ncbi:MAG: HK97 family phage prohead protease, partial [bacterium]
PVLTILDDDRVTKWVTQEIKGSRPDARTISFIASHERVDEDGELILVDGIDLTRYLANPILLMGHDYRAPAVGEVRNLQRTTVDGTRALTGEGFFPDRPRADEALADLRAGLLRGVSLGFRSLRQGPPRLPGQTGITHEQTRLIEISLVSLPACPTCLVTRKCARCASGWTPASAGRVAGDEFTRLWREKYGPPQNETRRQWREVVAVTRTAGQGERVHPVLARNLAAWATTGLGGSRVLGRVHREAVPLAGDDDVSGTIEIDRDQLDGLIEANAILAYAEALAAIQPAITDALEYHRDKVR